MRLVSFFSEHGDNPLFDLRRNERRLALSRILLEAMKLLAVGPLTKEELQKLVRIRKKTFLKLLAQEIRIGTITRIGMGKKRHPFKYVLTEIYENKS
ncbi:MAG: hypothetical protein KDD22_04360 [Bdellovibrionales bacterium]|nr:hypothetical protein [Bdellovibrionales bacterium]